MPVLGLGDTPPGPLEGEEAPDIGDASGNPGKLTDYLPAHYDQVPVFGNAPNDTWYAKVHGGDIYPDLFVGRIPARSASDVTTVINKIQAYEGSPPAGDWTQRAVLVADDGDSAFRGDRETVAALFEVFTYFGDPALRLNVTDAPIEGLSAGNDSPTQLASATTLSATVTSGTNVVYTWDFGDGSSPESGSPIQHTYPATGTYTAHVTATNGVGSQSQATAVTITDVPPAASFTSSTPDVLGQTTTFQSTSAGTNLVYEWDFGDGSPPTNSQAATITHTYAATGTYSVVLTASNSMNSSTVTGLVEIVDTLPVYLPLLFK